VLATYDDYLGAQAAVDTLSDNGFPVENVTIIGRDVRIVEAVLGRMSWGRAALGGMAMGAWFGLLIGLFVSLFAQTDGNVWALILLGVLYGAAFGIIFGLVSYAFTRGRRDFVSRQQLSAAHFDVLCDATVIDRARQILGLAGTPDAAPSLTTTSAGDGPGGPVTPAV
jgi:hypothetical protein